MTATAGTPGPRPVSLLFAVKLAWLSKCMGPGVRTQVSWMFFHPIDHKGGQKDLRSPYNDSFRHLNHEETHSFIERVAQCAFKNLHHFVVFLSCSCLSEQSAASVHRGLFNSVSCCLEPADWERGMISLIAQSSHTVQLERGDWEEAGRDVGIVQEKMGAV